MFVDRKFKVPKTLETDKFRLRMLTIHDVVKDYDAVMSSLNHLQGNKVFGPHSTWPKSSLTLEQDLIDLGWHQKEFQTKCSFTYTVMSPDENQCLGCVYFLPSTKESYDAEVYLWVRESEVEKGLDEELFKAVVQWLEDKWPFKNPALPGRKITWDKWEKVR